MESVIMASLELGPGNLEQPHRLPKAKATTSSEKVRRSEASETRLSKRDLERFAEAVGDEAEESGANRMSDEPVFVRPPKTKESPLPGKPDEPVFVRPPKTKESPLPGKPDEPVFVRPYKTKESPLPGKPDEPVFVRPPKTAPSPIHKTWLKKEPTPITPSLLREQSAPSPIHKTWLKKGPTLITPSPQHGTEGTTWNAARLRLGRVSKIKSTATREGVDVLPPLIWSAFNDQGPKRREFRRLFESAGSAIKSESAEVRDDVLGEIWERAADAVASRITQANTRLMMADALEVWLIHAWAQRESGSPPTPSQSSLGDKFVEAVKDLPVEMLKELDQTLLLDQLGPFLQFIVPPTSFISAVLYACDLLRAAKGM